MLRELGREASALGIARHYVGLLDGLIIDDVDSPLAPEIEALGIATIQTPTLMNTQHDRQQLAEAAVRFAASLRRAPSRIAMPRDSVGSGAT
jgi:LPPG:FO 2-phospho-L-lactate transferase